MHQAQVGGSTKRIVEGQEPAYNGNFSEKVNFIHWSPSNPSLKVNHLKIIEDGEFISKFISTGYLFITRKTINQ